MLGGLLINGYAAAQENDFSQIGKATQELTHEGFVAAHDSLAINQKVMVVNEENGKEVEVTIIEAAQSVSDRIIDLSADAWEALDLTGDNQVRLYLASSGPESNAVASEPAPPPPPPQSESAVQSKPKSTPRPAARPCPESAVQLPSSAFISDVEVIPGLPNPRNGKIYRLQVGSFSIPENASRLMRSIQNAGFTVIQESYGSWQRVLVQDIPAADVAATARKLGTLGIKQVWVRE